MTTGQMEIFPREDTNYEELMMKCVVCKNGETRPAEISALLKREGATVVFRDVPAAVCENCGEEYVCQQTASRLMELAEEAVHSRVEVEIRVYEAA